MGRALERRKDRAGAREFYEGALRLQPKWPEIRFALASVLVDLGETARAKDQFLQILKDDPANVGARRQLGLTLLALEDAKGAEVELARVVQARPDDGQARYDWGRALLVLGRRDEATAEFRKAHELDPGLPPPPGEQVDTPAK
jgi:Flp pilus assembly protein TadD